MSDAVPREIEGVFAKLLLVYGQRFVQFIAGQDIGTLKRHWAHELRGMNASDIAYGLTVLPPDFVPNVLQFKAACNRAPVQALRAIAGPPASPERVAAALGRLDGLRAEVRAKHDPHAWAHLILARHESGGNVPKAHRVMAQAALATRAPAIVSATKDLVTYAPMPMPGGAR